MTRFKALLVAALCSLPATDLIAEDSMTYIAPIETPFQASYLVRKKAEMSFEEFRTYQVEVHVPLVLALPGLQDYKLTFFAPQGDAEQPFHAMAQLTFADRAAHDAALGSEKGQVALADLPNMLNDPTEMVALMAAPGDIMVGTPQ